MFRKDPPSPFAGFEDRMLFGRVSEARLLTFLNLLVETLSGAARQTLAPPDLQTNLDSLTRQLSEIHAHAPALVLEEMHRDLKANNQLLSLRAQDLDFVRGLVHLMLRLNVRRIDFETGVTAGELGELVRVLAFPEVGARGAQDVETLLDRTGVTHVSLFSQVAPADDGAPGEEEPAPAPESDEASPAETTPQDEEAVLRAIASVVEEELPRFDDLGAFDLGSDEIPSDRAAAAPAAAAGAEPEEALRFDEGPGPEEAAFEYRRLDEPVRAGEGGDEEGMVELDALGDEGDQLLTDLEREEFDYDVRPAAPPRNGSTPAPERPAPDADWIAAEGAGARQTPAAFDEFDFPEPPPGPASRAENPLRDEEPEVSADVLEDLDFDVVDEPGGSATQATVAARPAMLAAEMIAVNVHVRVGKFPLAGATVTVEGTQTPPQMTQGTEGVSFRLPPGEHIFAVRYEEYTVKRKLLVYPGLADLDIDLQSIFNY